MSTFPIVPCLWFDDQAEAVANFYTKLFPEGRITAVSRYPESMESPGGKPPGSVLTVEFELKGQHFTALNGGPIFTINPSISLFVHVESAAEADRIFHALADGGQVLMPLDAYPWSERYGWVQDRFGVSFQVICGQPQASGAMFAPCLMFSDAQHGRAEEAINTYTRIFKGGRIERLERYAPGEGDGTGVKHGRFVIAGQPMVAMDSHIKHGFTFNEGLSLQVMCKDQAEIDHYWKELTEGGAESQCGWLKDRFGVSWQIVPKAIADWMASDDKVARERAFAAMMGMVKLDIAQLEAAFKGA